MRRTSVREASDKICSRSVLIEPAVEPAMPPTNIRPTISMPSAGTQRPKSAVPKPVVVTIVNDVKSASLIVSRTGPPHVPMAIRTAATATIPR